MAKKAKLYDGMQDINLTDTLIGQSFNKEISTSLSPSQSDIQTDPSNPRSGSENDLSPSTSNDQGHDQMSRSQLCKEQHSDSEICLGVLKFFFVLLAPYVCFHIFS